MRDSINEAIASTVSDMLEADLKVSFTKKELDKLGIKLTPVSFSSETIQEIRKTLGVSQSVFAKLLNVFYRQ
jgi:putative transcriptional regulator